MKRNFDLVIIGGGAGAFAAAIRANELGAKTAVVNAGLPIGGTCVNVGCVPSKTLLWVGELLNLVENHRIPGVELGIKKFDFQEVIRDELNLVERLRQEKYEKVISSLENVSLINGRARFVSQEEVEVNSERIKGDKFIIAVGSTARIPLTPGLKQAGFITHVEALRLKKKPRRLVVLGGGPVGLEFSQMYSRFGTEVVILQRRSSIFPRGEEELTDRLTDILTREGLVIRTNAIVKRVEKNGEDKRVVFEVNGGEEEVVADEILLAVGKVPNTQNLGLEKIGVEKDERGRIIVNQFLQTSNERVFAVGDVIKAPLRLETTAGYEGSLAAENLLRKVTRRVDYDSVPYTVFTDPQLAGVGWTEKDQVKALGRCFCRTVSFDKVPKAIIIRRTEGLVKMIVHPETKRILGVHILAPNAGDLIAQPMIVIKNKNTIDDLLDSLPVFPTLSEAIKLVALSFKKDLSKLSCCI